MTNFFIIGISDNANPWFPPEVMEIIHSGRVFSGGKRHHDIVAPLLPEGARWIDIVAPLDTVFAQYTPPEIIVFASGDPLFFGFANTIRRRMPEARIVVYPAFNSLQTLAHRLLMAYDDMRTVSLTGRPWPAFDRALIEGADKIGILTDRAHSPAAIAARMLDYGYSDYTMHIGERLGNRQEERIATLTLAEALQRDYDDPNCIILTRTEGAAGGVGGCRRQASPGIPDSAFVRLDGREKMITKMPIRLLTLQALGLSRRHCLWDIGACTGSVSIEARRMFPHLRIDAFEIRPACEAIIRENARRLGAPGIELHMGDFLEADCDGIAAAPPDAVFIGGHSGRLKEIMAKVLRYLAPDGCIVMNSVEAPRVHIDSRTLWYEACETLGLTQATPMRIQLNDYHPITILTCRR